MKNPQKGLFFVSHEVQEEEPGDGNQQRGQQVERLAVLQVQQAEAASSDHQSAHDQQFRHQGIAHSRTANLRYEVEHALPEEEHGRCQHHADAVGRGEDSAAHEVERGIREEEGVVALQRRNHRSQHRERADAVEQDRRAEPVAQTILALPLRALVDEPLEAPVDVEPCADDASHGQRHDEEHGVLALGQVCDGGIQADGQRGQAQTRVEHLLVLLLHAPVQQRSDQGACDDGAGVNDSSNHIVLVLSEVRSPDSVVRLPTGYNSCGGRA